MKRFLYFFVAVMLFSLTASAQKKIAVYAVGFYNQRLFWGLES